MTLGLGRFPLFSCLLLFGVIAATLVGCDGGNTKREFQAQQFTGRWNVDCIRADNSGCRQVRATSWFKFSDGSGQKSYRLSRIGEDDTTTAEGQIEVVNDGLLRMKGPFPGVLLWEFDFEADEPDPLPGSVRLRLIRGTRDNSVQEFLDFFDRNDVGREVWMDLFAR